MGHWISGFQPKLLTGKLGPGELGSFRLGQVVRSYRRVWVKEDLSGQWSLGRGSMCLVDRVRGASVWKIHSEIPRLFIKWNLRHGNSGQYRSEEITLAREALVTGQGDEFQSGTVLRCPGRRRLCFSLVELEL